MASPDAYRRHYSLKHRLIARLSRALSGVTYTVRHGLITGLKRKGGLGFLPEWVAHRQTSAEERFFLGLQLQQKVVYDVGAFEGLLTLFFASRARQVVAYEPNPQSRARLLENVRLNGFRNVTVRPVGLGADEAVGSLRVDKLMPGGASAAASIASQIAASVDATDVPIVVTTLDLDVGREQLPAPDFVKIDIEGMEQPALQGMRGVLASARPDLYIELHGMDDAEKAANVKGVVDFLWGLGYRTLVHIESGAAVVPGATAASKEGHLYCRFSGPEA